LDGFRGALQLTTHDKTHGMTPVLTIILLLAGGLLFLYFGAESLIRGSASLAQRLGLSPLVIGLTVVAYGTSTPELAVSVKAALEGNGVMALGNVVGSNICNLGLILGLAACIHPLRVQMQLLRLDVPVMIACSLLFPLLLWDGIVSRVEGFLLVIGIVTYTVVNLRLARREQNPIVLEEFAKATVLAHPRRRVGLDVILIVVGIALLVLGGRLFVDGAVDLAVRIGISEAVIALTVVAAGTSLPELAATVVAALRGEADIAVGNIIGSSIFNLTNIVGISALARPLEAHGLAGMDIAVMIALAVISAPLLRSGFTVHRWEGVLFLLSYIAYVFYLWAR
jgi:cation:H+ antiporter